MNKYIVNICTVLLCCVMVSCGSHRFICSSLGCETKEVHTLNTSKKVSLNTIPEVIPLFSIDSVRQVNDVYKTNIKVKKKSLASGVQKRTFSAPKKIKEKYKPNSSIDTDNDLDAALLCGIIMLIFGVLYLIFGAFWLSVAFYVFLTLGVLFLLFYVGDSAFNFCFGY